MKDIATKSTTQYILDKYDLYPKKKYGQNFLIDPHVVEKIVRCSSVNEKCAVIEVGPGIGALTQVLARYAGYVRSYEIDTRFKGVYEEFLNQENIEIVFEDFLKVNLEDLMTLKYKYEKVILVANLPYYITTPIILKLLSETTRIKTYTMMMQDEVANRICSKPDVKDYNALSVCIQYRALSSKVLNISRNIFVPKPNVDSAVIRLELFDAPPYKAKDEVFFFKLIRDAFCQRRKTLVNNLKQTGYDKTVVLDALTYLGLPEAIRSEALNVEEFVKLSDYLLPYHNNK